MIDQEPRGIPYMVSAPRTASFKLVWWPIEDRGQVCWSLPEDRPHCREVIFTCLAVFKRQGWEIHNITPAEPLPPMGKAGMKHFMAILKAAIQDTLGNTGWDFQPGIIDWEGSKGF